MCGILIHKGNGNNERIQKRGQDCTNEYKKDGYTFVHNLLSVTGEFTKQPFIDGNIVCEFNGEIYNQKFVKSDGECLIPLYKKYGINFPKYLEGEFAIALYDFDKRIVVFAKDPFGSKPLFVYGTECGSYRSGVGGEKLAPNTIRVTNMDDESFYEKKLYEWNFEQFKTTYDDWIAAFEKAIAKRAKGNCFLGLSSGYDSGAIACEMLKQGIDFKAYVFKGSEDKEVLDKRLKLVKDYEYFEPKRYDLPIDNEPYTILYDGVKTDMMLLDDHAVFAVATICDKARQEGRKVILSGQGADEITSDYSLFPSQSSFKGVFPAVLKQWPNFEGSCQESYLMKEEYAGGAFNIETRYPFLDKDVVQEFLWLSQELKNKHYKAPIREYLIRNNFPFQEGRKIGFGVSL